MTYEELIAFGQKHYNNGGDVFVECWERSDYDEYIKECGEITEEVAKALMNFYDDSRYLGEEFFDEM